MNTAIFKNRNFSLLVFGKFISIIGTQMQNFALSLYVLKATGSAAQFSLLISLNFIPHILFGSIGGVFADHFSKKKILVISDIISGSLTLLFIFYVQVYGFSYFLACLLVFLLATVNVFFSPAIDALIPISVGQEQIMQANTMNRFVINVGKFIAPLLAGILFPLTGLILLLLIDGATFLLSAFSELFIIPEKKEKTKEPLAIKKVYMNLLDGFKYVWHHHSIRHLLNISFVFNFFLYPMFAIMIPFVLKTVMGVSDFKYGISISAYTLAVAVSLMLIKKKNEKGHLLKLFNIGITCLSIIVVGIGIVFITIGNTDSFISYGLLVICNIAFGYFIVYWAMPSMSFYHLATPKEMLGRVMGVQNVNEKLGCILGQLVIGSLADFIAPGILVIASGILLMITAFIGSGVIKRQI